MKITEPDDAAQYLASYVEYIQGHMEGDVDAKGRTAEDIAKINLGYYAGYHDHDTRVRVEHLFCTKHPVLGPATPSGPSVWNPS